MADDVDVANEVVQRAAEDRTAQIQASLQGAGQEFCEECDCVIPPARRAAMKSATRCAPCQEVVDIKGRVWR